MVPFQKGAQGWTACSYHGAFPALNIFKLSAGVPMALKVHPTKILLRNFLFAAIAHGRISLVLYQPFARSIFISNLACSSQWHG
jgi:hypothetical protein